MSLDFWLKGGGEGGGGRGGGEGGMGVGVGRGGEEMGGLERRFEGQFGQVLPLPQSLLPHLTPPLPSFHRPQLHHPPRKQPCKRKKGLGIEKLSSQTSLNFKKRCLSPPPPEPSPPSLPPPRQKKESPLSPSPTPAPPPQAPI